MSFTNNKLKSDFLPGNYVTAEISGKKMEDVAIIPRHAINNDGDVFVIREGMLAVEDINVLVYQDDIAIVKRSIPEESKLVSTILQKPLVGMKIDSINDPELVEEEVAVTDSAIEANSELN